MVLRTRTGTEAVPARALRCPCDDEQSGTARREGGAHHGRGGGLGRVAAELFAGEGGPVVIADVIDGDDAVDAIADAGGEAAFVATDVTDDASVAAAVAFAVETFGGLHVLYNNAGISPADDDGPTNTSDETWQRRSTSTSSAIARCCRHGIPAMLDSGGGSIVNVASFVAHMGAATPQIAYTASKGAVLSMTREIAVIYARQGIRANALCPGPVLTPLLAKFLVRRRQAPTPPRARADGPLRRADRDRQRRAVPRQRRVVVHDRAVAAHRRRHHRRLHDSGVTRVEEPHRPRSTSCAPTSSAGAIDTVLAVFADHQGRLIGKRTDGEFFFDTVLADGTENCDYLLACDLDYTPLPGFRWASYDQGYGDMRGVVDPTTIRYLPWLEAPRW